jgi:hypothetical protein
MMASAYLISTSETLTVVDPALEFRPTRAWIGGLDAEGAI